MAARNANDAISMVQIAQGALEGVSSMLLQMKELVTRSVNGSFTGEQRKTVMQRIGDLRDEINATADRTTMNNLRLLQGDFSIPVMGDFDELLGEVEADQPTLQSDSTVKTGIGSSLSVSGASRISVRSTDTEVAPMGEYQFSSNNNVVTLTRTNGTSVTSQSITLTSSAPGAGEVRVPTAAGQAFTLNFNNLNTSVTYQVDQFGTRNTAEDYAVLVANLGATPSASTWRAVSGANIATGAASDQVVAKVTANGGFLKLSTIAGLTPLGGYGDAASWTAGSTPSLGLIGTVANVNAALATLQVQSPGGLGDIDISITPQFQNSVFFDNTVTSSAGTRVSIPGWDIYNERFILGSSSVSGQVSSNADNAMPAQSPSYSSTSASAGTTYSYEFSADVPTTVTGQSLRLYSEGMTTDRYGVVHGPYVVSQNAVALTAGDTVTFNWKSQAGSDAYDSYAYLLNTGNGAQVELLDVTGTTGGTTPWNTATVNVPSTGNYKFVFIAGTFDATGGQAAGGSLYLTNIQINPSDPATSTLKAFNIGNGGIISMDNAITLTDVQFTGVGPWSASDGIYRMIADDDLQTVTLKQYDVDLNTLIREETISQVSAFGINETRTLSFPTLGVGVTLRNNANESLWLGANKSGYEIETLVAQNKRIDTNVNVPTFQISDGSKFDVRINELQDIRMGSNGDSQNAPLFNRMNRLINSLTQGSDPPMESLRSLSVLVDDTVERVAEMRGRLAGVVNRMSSAIENISTQVSSFASSQKRVEDTDYASEVAHLVHLRAQRDMSAATMAHLNAQPKVVLWLLQDEKASKASRATEFTPVKTTMNRTSALAAYA
jgi:flagellin-like hook-associated protein FlgL